MDKEKTLPVPNKDAIGHANREAELLTAELESPFGAQNLGDEAFKTAQEDAAKIGMRI